MWNLGQKKGPCYYTHLVHQDLAVIVWSAAQTTQSVLVKSILWQMQSFLISRWIESGWKLTEAQLLGFTNALSHIWCTLSEYHWKQPVVQHSSSRAGCGLAPLEVESYQCYLCWLSDAALCVFNRKWVLYLLIDKPLYPFKNVQRSDLSFIAEHLPMCGQPWCWTILTFSGWLYLPPLCDYPGDFGRL